MKYLITSFIFILSISLSTAQVEEKAYPITNNPDSEEAQQLLTYFKSENVGNEHVYSFMTDEPEEDYIYAGTAIPRDYHHMFEQALQKQLMAAKMHLYAVQTIRGEAEQYYLIRMPGLNGNSKLALFGLQDDNMLHLLDLADAGEGFQQDAWIQDIDGDTRLDIILHSSKAQIKGRPVNTLTIYQQTDNGSFLLNEEMNLEPRDYPMQDLHDFTMEAGKRKIKMKEKPHPGKSKKKKLKSLKKQKKKETQ